MWIPKSALPKLLSLGRFCTTRPELRCIPQKFQIKFYTTDPKITSSPVWKIGRLNHVALAVPDIEQAAALYRDVLGAKVSDVVALPEHGVYTVFVELDNTKIELLLPYGDKSPIQSFLDKNKSGGLHHVCLEVNDIEAAILDVKSKGIRTLTETSRIGAHGKPVIFLHPKDCNGVLTELEQV
ncbi:MCEE [Bugula neritina]|uniref:Methylmalonyl-CoA epimerase, mitochondrial n=1 Tax=Bugula neritina TaxID=10212 RepID=A0A7J7KC55_BUGNE|nr:MCEE [Bugula neritina]